MAEISANGSSRDMYFSQCASTLSKRPMGEIAEEEVKKRGAKKKLKPSTKKAFTNVVSKINTGVKKTKTAVNVRQSNDLTAKKKDELFGRVNTETIARFLTQKIT